MTKSDWEKLGLSAAYCEEDTMSDILRDALERIEARKRRLERLALQIIDTEEIDQCRH